VPFSVRSCPSSPRAPAAPPQRFQPRAGASEAPGAQRREAYATPCPPLAPAPGFAKLQRLPWARAHAPAAPLAACCAYWWAGLVIAHINGALRLPIWRGGGRLVLARQAVLSAAGTHIAAPIAAAPALIMYIRCWTGRTTQRCTVRGAARLRLAGRSQQQQQRAPQCTPTARHAAPLRLDTVNVR
jgi:hypothetical protein